MPFIKRFQGHERSYSSLWNPFPAFTIFFKMLATELPKLLQMVCREETPLSSSCVMPFALQDVTLHWLITMVPNVFSMPLHWRKKLASCNCGILFFLEWFWLMGLISRLRQISLGFSAQWCLWRRLCSWWRFRSGAADHTDSFTPQRL